MHKMFEQNEILTIDKVYSNLYSISRKSLDEILCQNRIPIKEVHPSNHEKVKNIFPNSISVLIDSDRFELIGKRKYSQERINSDDNFFSQLDHSHFDIVFKADPSRPADILAENLHYLLYSHLSSNQYFPNAKIIDSKNFKGYTKTAPEFNENKRITTKDFHTLSHSFFINAVKKYIKPNMKCIEIGPGHGWLKDNIPLPNEIGRASCRERV